MVTDDTAAGPVSGQVLARSGTTRRRAHALYLAERRVLQLTGLPLLLCWSLPKMPILRHRCRSHLIQRCRSGELMAFSARTRRRGIRGVGLHEDGGQNPAPRRSPAAASAAWRGLTRMEPDDPTSTASRQAVTSTHLTKPPFCFRQARPSAARPSAENLARDTAAPGPDGRLRVHRQGDRSRRARPAILPAAIDGIPGTFGSRPGRRAHARSRAQPRTCGPGILQVMRPCRRAPASRSVAVIHRPGLLQGLL